MRASTKLVQPLRRQNLISLPSSSSYATTLSRSSRLPLRPSVFTSPLTRLQKSPAFRYTSLRHESTSTTPGDAPRPLTDRVPNAHEDAHNANLNAERRAQEPVYQITFTCNPCGNRSSHQISHHGYHKGTVLIQCPHCTNRHIISDHLGVFMDQKGTVEDILAKQGRKVTKGHVEGGLEIWDDGTVHDATKDETSPSEEASAKRPGPLP